jgi:hypothetical protein
MPLSGRHEFGDSIPANAERRLVEPNRRLLKDGVAAQFGLEEFSAPQLDSRIITIPLNTETARTHEDLMEMRLPVFSTIYHDKSMWLLVPEDARPLRGVLRFIARDIGNYDEIFYQVGETLGQLEEAGIGLPEPRPDKSILNNFAFSLDEGEIYGGKVSLIPPYPLNPMKTMEQELGGIFMELTDSHLFQEHETALLVEKLQRGWRDVR